MIGAARTASHCVGAHSLGSEIRLHTYAIAIKAKQRPSKTKALASHTRKLYVPEVAVTVLNCSEGRTAGTGSSRRSKGGVVDDAQLKFYSELDVGTKKKSLEFFMPLSGLVLFCFCLSIFVLWNWSNYDAWIGHDLLTISSFLYKPDVHANC